MERFDIAIIGGGPAGFTAAVYACRAGYSAIVFEKASHGGQMGITSEIENYPGFARVDGFDLAMKMMNQAKGLGAVIKTEEVTSVDIGGREKFVTTTRNQYEAGAVIIAGGAKPRLLGVPGEEQYKGRGVSYCATCDGMFFRGKTVIVNGGGDTAFEDAVYLSNVCEKVYLVHRRNSFRASAASVKRAQAKENIEFVYSSVIEEITGDGMRVTGAKLKNVESGEITEIGCAGVFVAVGRVPDTEIYAGKLDLDGSGYIVADETCRTNIPGVFAAGDVRTKHLRQIVTACADGATAVKFAEEWLTEITE
ncbi:MAG: thioredoxin-disulfide reductase [Ruminococcaceae bacterium]|nr:thioredoxin-disulfide reductase [Oscillospiraceae bacterium]